MKDKTEFEKVKMMIELRRRALDTDLENCRPIQKEYFVKMVFQ